MPRRIVNGAGEVGLLNDMPYGEVPDNGWTAGRNVRMRKGLVVAFPGDELATAVPLLTEVWALAAADSLTQHYWVIVGPEEVGGAKTVLAFDGSTFSDITGAGVTGTQQDVFTGLSLNGNLVWTDGADNPQVWNLNPGSPSTDLPGWDTAWKCKTISTFKGFLVAGNMTEAPNVYPYRVRWSHESVPGGIPDNWDDADPTKFAGFQDLGDITSEIRALSPLRDVHVIYSTKETVGMQLVGGNDLWRFYVISRESGAISSRAVATFRGQHVVVNDSDIVVCNGQSVQSIVDRKRKDFFFSSLNDDQRALVWARAHPQTSEVWIGFPTDQSTYCNRAMVWNWRTDTWGDRDLPVGNYAAAEGLDIIGRAVLTWATTPGTWAENTDRWNASNRSNAKEVLLLGADPSTGNDARVLYTERGNLFDGQPRSAYVEKLGMRVSEDRVVTCHKLHPRVSGGPIRIRAGGQFSTNGPVNWSSVRTFVPGRDDHVTFRVSGRYISVSFESFDELGMELEGWSLEYKDRARR